jgi:hypothetical protein
MTYPILDDDDISAWNDDYKVQADALAAEDAQAEKAKLTAKLQSIGTQVEEHLNGVGRTLRVYFDRHDSRVNNWLNLSEKSITGARKAAAAYKKDTSTGVPAQLQQSVSDLDLWAKAITDDARLFGAAWFKYRNNPANNVPLKYQASFAAIRQKVMEDQKAVTTKATRIKGYKAEAEALLQVAAKATMKAGIKAGTGAQRLVAAAQQDARDFAAQMAAEFDLLQSPPGLATQPGAISNALGFVKDDAKNKNFTKTTANAAAVAGRKKTFDSGLKLMRTRLASMEKLHTTKLKGFRSNELSDAAVKTEIKKAEKSLKDARAAVKVSDAEAKKGQGYIAVIEARWAAEAKKKK